jgi:DNA-binding MarR family transcriptional regulator
MPRPSVFDGDGDQMPNGRGSDLQRRADSTRAQGKQGKKDPRVGPPKSPATIIEAELDPSGDPVLGLYLHVAYMMLMSTFAEKVGHGEITPNLIGALALVRHNPGTNQASLARVIGIERATAGEQISRLIERGFLRRDLAEHDSRSYALYITPQGERMLEKLRERIPVHERQIGARLTLAERKQLRALLQKFVYG